MDLDTFLIVASGVAFVICLLVRRCAENCSYYKVRRT